MSRIGKLPVKIPAGVTVTAKDGNVSVKGPLGELSLKIAGPVGVEIKDGQVVLVPGDEEKSTGALHGLYRSLVRNMVEGVTKGYEKRLMISGVGIKVVVQEGKLVMNIGFSHPVEIAQPDGITFTVISATPNLVELSVRGIDKEAVGRISSTIKAVKKVEPYHGYGIYYKDEPVIRKEGKTAGK